MCTEEVVSKVRTKQHLSKEVLKLIVQPSGGQCFMVVWLGQSGCQNIPAIIRKLQRGKKQLKLNFISLVNSFN